MIQPVPFETAGLDCGQGYVSYRATVDVEVKDGDRLRVDSGSIRDRAQIFWNGKFLGVVKLTDAKVRRVPPRWRSTSYSEVDCATF